MGFSCLLLFLHFSSFWVVIEDRLSLLSRPEHAEQSHLHELDSLTQFLGKSAEPCHPPCRNAPRDQAALVSSLDPRLLCSGQACLVYNTHSTLMTSGPGVYRASADPLNPSHCSVLVSHLWAFIETNA